MSKRKAEPTEDNASVACKFSKLTNFTQSANLSRVSMHQVIDPEKLKVSLNVSVVNMINEVQHLTDDYKSKLSTYRFIPLSEQTLLLEQICAAKRDALFEINHIKDEIPKHCSTEYYLCKHLRRLLSSPNPNQQYIQSVTEKIYDAHKLISVYVNCLFIESLYYLNPCESFKPMKRSMPHKMKQLEDSINIVDNCNLLLKKVNEYFTTV